MAVAVALVCADGGIGGENGGCYAHVVYAWQCMVYVRRGAGVAAKAPGLRFPRARLYLRTPVYHNSLHICALSCCIAVLVSTVISAGVAVGAAGAAAAGIAGSVVVLCVG